MTGKSLVKIAGLIAIITVLSKIFGFARDVVTAQTYGASLVSDAYFYAYQIPALSLILLGGLGGPFHTATIAFFSKLVSDITKKPSKEVQLMLNSFITLTGLGFLILSILIFVFSDQVIQIVASGADPKLQHLASMQLKIMSPVMLIGGIIGIFYGIANIHNEFLCPSLSPTIASIAIIAALLLFNNDEFGIVLAWATLIGSVGELIIQLPAFFKAGYVYKPEFQFKADKRMMRKKFFIQESSRFQLCRKSQFIQGHKLYSVLQLRTLKKPEFCRYLKFSTVSISKIGEILFPAMIATTIGQINIYVDMFFASRLEPGAWSAIGYANRIFQFPVGIIITALLVPLFPMFSTFVGKKQWDELKYYFHKGLGSLWFLSFPILAFIIIFAQDGIKLVFQRGQFDANDTAMVTLALIFLSVSIIPYVARDTLTRIFYAFDDSKTPFAVATFSIVVKAVMNFLFVSRFGIGGITLSTTVVTLVNALLLATFIRKKIDLEYKKLINPAMKIIAATLIMSVVAYGSKILFDRFMPDATIYLLVKLGLCTIISCITYAVTSLILKIHAAEHLMERAKGYIFKSSEPSQV